MRRMRRHFEVACVILDNLKVDRETEEKGNGRPFFRMRISATTSSHLASLHYLFQ